MLAAKSGVADIDARDALRLDAGWVSAEALGVAISYADKDDYLHDRARRLLVSLRDGGPVPGADPATLERMALEGQLGRLPLPEAFGQLAAMEPRLGALAARLDLKRRNVGREVQKVVGPRSGNRDPLLASETAEWIAVRYLWLSPRRRRAETRSHFELGGFEFRGGSRPDAI